MNGLENGLILFALFAILGAGAWTIDKIDKRARRNSDETPGGRAQSSRPALVVGIIFLVAVVGVAIHLNGGMAKTLGEASGGDPESNWRR